MAYERSIISCPSSVLEEGEKYASILDKALLSTGWTKCITSPIYYHVIHFGGVSALTVSSIEIMDTDVEVLIRGELVTESESEEEVAGEIRKIKTRDPEGMLEETPCAVTMIHRHKYEGREISHIHFICSTASLIHRSENIERILRGIRRIVDKYVIRE